MHDKEKNLASVADVRAAFASEADEAIARIADRAARLRAQRIARDSLGVIVVSRAQEQEIAKLVAAMLYRRQLERLIACIDSDLAADQGVAAGARGVN